MLDGEPRREVRAARVVIKDAAFAVFTAMIGLIDEHPGPSQLRQLITRLDAMLDEQVEVLRSRMAATVPTAITSPSTSPAIPRLRSRLFCLHPAWLWLPGLPTG